MADNKNKDLQVNLPFISRLKLAFFALAKLLYIRRDGTINRRILNLLDWKNAAPAKKLIGEITVSTSDVPIDPSRSLWFRLYTPNTTHPKMTKLPLIVYFHGGGFNTFTPNSQGYDQLCSHLAAKIPAIIASVNYRLAPEHRYPCQYEDSFNALKFINDQKNSTIFPPDTDFEKCFIGGDSAGGNIAHHLTIRACKNLEDFKNLRIVGVVGVQPFFGGEERTGSELRLRKAPVLDVKQTDWMWRMFLPEGSDRDHSAVNVWRDFEVAKEMKILNFPSVLVIIGELDPLQDWQKRYVDGLKKCGKEVETIEYPNAFHGFYAFPELPLMTRFKLGIQKFARGIYVRSDGTINRRLLSLIDIKASSPATKLINNTEISTSDIQIDPSNNLWFRLFNPSRSENSLPFIVYFHGGGFRIYRADSKIFDDLCSHIAAKVPAVVASVNYHLAPEHKYPTQYDDAFEAVTFIDSQNYTVLPANTDLNRCFIGGDSAGGNIAHHLAVRALQNANQFEKMKIGGVIELQPFFGGQERTESELRLKNAPIINATITDGMWRNFLPEGADRNHPAAKVFGGGVDSEAAKVIKTLNFPRMLVIVGGDDPLQDWQRQYVEWMKNCEKEVEMIEYLNAFHGFYGFPELPEFSLLIDDVKDFIQKQEH